MEKKQGFSYLCYRIIRWLVWAFYPKIKVEGGENLPEEPCLVVGNHAQMHGPISCELYFPGAHYTWCIGHMMHMQEVPDYAYQDFWSGKPQCIRWFYRALSYIIAPLSVCVFNNANTISVYRDKRIVDTFRETLSRLTSGANVVIFPEHEVHHNHIINDFQDGFVDIAKRYHRQTGKALPFVPLYIAPDLKAMYLGASTRFRPDAPIKEERSRVCRYLMGEVTAIASALPRHTVVPYLNIPKKDYPTNIPCEVSNHNE